MADKQQTLTELFLGFLGDHDWFYDESIDSFHRLLDDPCQVFQWVKAFIGDGNRVVFEFKMAILTNRTTIDGTRGMEYGDSRDSHAKLSLLDNRALLRRVEPIDEPVRLDRVELWSEQGIASLREFIETMGFEEKPSN